jgi:Transposase DDE domain
MKVSKMMAEFSSKIGAGHSKPMMGYVREMLYGIATGRSTMLSDIGRSLGEDADLITTEMRLSRNLANRNLDDSAMRAHYLEAVKPFVADAVVALDFSEIRKDFSQKQEWLCDIWDNSVKEKAQGYWLLNIEAIDGEERHFPLWLEPFSQNAPEYKSQACTVENALRHVAAVTGKRCIWVLDRGFDGEKYIHMLEAAGVTYGIRQVGKRHVRTDTGRLASTAEIAATMETPHIGKWRAVSHGREYPMLFHYGSTRIEFPKDGTTRQLIVVRIAGHKNPLMILTNSLTRKPEAILKIAIAYFKRWGIEEATRLVKQVFELENVRAMSFAGIQRITLFASLAYGFLCLFAKRAGKTALALALRFYKSFTPNVPPHFIYYRLAHSLAAMLLCEGPPGAAS